MNDLQSIKRKKVISQAEETVKATEELINKTLKEIGISKEEFLLYKLNNKRIH